MVVPVWQATSGFGVSVEVVCAKAWKDHTDVKSKVVTTAGDGPRTGLAETMDTTAIANIGGPFIVKAFG